VVKKRKSILIQTQSVIVIVVQKVSCLKGENVQSRVSPGARRVNEPRC